MGERLLCKQEVIGSIPFTSTTGPAPPARLSGALLRSEKPEIPSGVYLSRRAGC